MRLCLTSLKTAGNKRVFLGVLAAVLVTGPSAAYALERLGEALELYRRERYRAAFERTRQYLRDYPRDALGAELSELFALQNAFTYLKRGYTLRSEGLDRMADKEFEKASEFHPEFTRETEEKFTELLEEHTVREASNRMLFSLLEDPRPPEAEIYRVSALIRERLADMQTDIERLDYEALEDRVSRFRQRERWSDAAEMIADFIKNNPGSAQAKVLLSEINREAAQHFYSRAVEELERNRRRDGRRYAETSRQHDYEWFEAQVEKELDEAKVKIALEEFDEAKEQLKILENLNPEDPIPEMYLGFFDEDESDFFERSMEEYLRSGYREAASRFDFLRLMEPENLRAQLYYHLASARAYIQERNLDKIREHLMRALEISPGEREALEIFDRLQDVMEIMG